ncbi:peptidase M23 family [Prevotella sp. CAG:1058]|nr:peptidase M23 family [Prevotella sp. CAG:1058]
MRLKRTIKTLAITAFLAMTAATASAQDLLARQAPIDKKMKAVDTLALRNLINKEQMGSPSAQLYKEWNNKYAHRATELPDSFLINLKHFCMPTTSKVITSNFGRRWGRMHKGIDVKVYIGDTIRSAFSGKVRIVKYEANGYGNYVVIRHYNGLETIYGHMSKHLVKENQIVKAGEPIGLGGNTGRSTGSHLHFETRLCGVALNPALMFDFRNQDVTGDTYMFHRDTYENESVLANKARGKSAGDDEAVAEETSSSKSRKQSSASSSDIRYHKVKRGETLSSIAKKRGTTIDKLCKLNHISKRMRIRPGQILRYS